MAGELFDPERLRKRWLVEDRSVPESAPSVVHPKFQAVIPATDGLSEARALLQNVRERAAKDLPHQREILGPFFEDAEQALKTLADTQDEAARAPQAEAALEVLWRIEDLLEAYYFIVK
jgi:hypothetical protein